MLTQGISSLAGCAGLGLVLSEVRDLWRGRRVSLWKLVTGTTLLVASSWIQAVQNTVQLGFPLGAAAEPMNTIDAVKKDQLNQYEIRRWARAQMSIEHAFEWLKTVQLQGHPIVIVGEHHDSPLDMQQLISWIVNREVAFFVETIFRDETFEAAAKKAIQIPRDALLFGIEGVDSIITDYVYAIRHISYDGSMILKPLKQLAMVISQLSSVADFWSDFCKKEKSQEFSLFTQTVDMIVGAMREKGVLSAMPPDIFEITSPKYAQRWIDLFEQLARHAVDYFTLPRDVKDAVLELLDQPMSLEASEKFYDRVNIAFRDQVIAENVFQTLPKIPKGLPAIIKVGGDHVLGIFKELKKISSRKTHEEL